MRGVAYLFMSPREIAVMCCLRRALRTVSGVADAIGDKDRLDTLALLREMVTRDLVRVGGSSVSLAPLGVEWLRGVGLIAQSGDIVRSAS